MKIQILFTYIFVLLIAEPALNAQTLDRKQQVEKALSFLLKTGYVHNTFDKDLQSVNRYADALYADEKSVVYFYRIFDRKDKHFEPIKSYVNIFNLMSNNNESFVPYPFIQNIPYPYGDRALDIPIQKALFQKDDKMVVIEMNYPEKSWNELYDFPTKNIPQNVKYFQEPDQYIYSYPMNGFEHNNPYLFGLNIYDGVTGENKNILEDIHCQNMSYSSMSSRFSFLPLKDGFILYSETINPYKIGSSIDDREKSYNQLYLMNVPSGDKIPLATSELQMYNSILDRNPIIWNGKNIENIDEKMNDFNRY